MQGFGLYKSEFGNGQVGGSRKKFDKRSSYFLESRYVRQLKATDGRSDGCFSIRSLGIVESFRQRNIANERQFMMTIKILQLFMKLYIKKHMKNNDSSFYALTNLDSITRIKPKIDKQIMFDSLTSALRSVMVNSSNEVDLINRLDGRIFQRTTKFALKNNEIEKFDLKDNSHETIPEDELDYYLSYFLIISFHLYLLRYLDDNKQSLRFYDQNILKEISIFYENIIDDNLQTFNSLYPIKYTIDKEL